MSFKMSKLFLNHLKLSNKLSDLKMTSKRIWKYGTRFYVGIDANGIGWFIHLEAKCRHEWGINAKKASRKDNFIWYESYLIWAILYDSVTLSKYFHSILIILLSLCFRTTLLSSGMLRNQILRVANVKFRFIIIKVFLNLVKNFKEFTNFHFVIEL